MISLRPLLLAAMALAAVQVLAADGDDSFKAPDSLVLKDGRTIRGLILKNTAHTVIMQERFTENTYRKSDIVRIRDEADIETLFTESTRIGDLPAWRVIANDLRAQDKIKSLVEIPATTIDIGEFRLVPYKSFRVNNDVELNIYGDPEDPSAIEIGIYGAHSGNDRARKVLRSFLAGYLSSRKEIAALYSVPLTGGIAEAGELTFEVTPKTGVDAFGAWWISIYDRKALAAARMSSQDYARLTRPASEVIDRKGRVIDNGWTQRAMSESNRIKDLGPSTRVMLKGFYRDDKGVFRLIQEPVPAS